MPAGSQLIQLQVDLSQAELAARHAAAKQLEHQRLLQFPETCVLLVYAQTRCFVPNMQPKSALLLDALNIDRWAGLYLLHVWSTT